MGRVTELVSLSREGQDDTLLATHQVWQYILPGDTIKVVDLGSVEIDDNKLPVPSDGIEKQQTVYGIAEGLVLTRAFIKRKPDCNVKLNAEIAKAFHRKELPEFSYMNIVPIPAAPPVAGEKEEVVKPTATPVRVFVISYYNLPSADVLSELEVSKLRFVPIEKVTLRFKQTMSEHNIETNFENVETEIQEAFPNHIKDLFGTMVLVTVRS